MLHTETVEGRTLDLIKQLSADRELSAFYLVGGTALALQIGHRISVDIDLFTCKKFDPAELSGHIAKQYNAENTKTIKDALFTFIEGIKVDIVSHEYDWINPLHQAEGIRMASLEDIAAMKLNAIVRSGSRLKDFVDVYMMLERMPFQKMAEAYSTKYPDSSADIAKLALLFHEEIDHDNPVRLLDREEQWAEMAERLRKAVIEPAKIFSPQSTKDTPKKENKQMRQKYSRRERGFRP